MSLGGKSRYARYSFRSIYKAYLRVTFQNTNPASICLQEENKILDKKNRQKVLEVEKLSQTIENLEEAILAGGAAANSIRDYKRQISELNVRTRSTHVGSVFGISSELSLCSTF